MDDRPLPLDVARSLVHCYGQSALDIARNRAAVAHQAGCMKDHDHALMVLNEVEDILMECEIGTQAGASAFHVPFWSLA